MLQTTLAGSLPKPSWLAEPEKLWAPWRLEGAELEAGKRDAALVWLKEQEDAGIDIVTNGEQFRVHFVHGFLQDVEGIDWTRQTKMGIRADRYFVELPIRVACLQGSAVEARVLVNLHNRSTMRYPFLIGRNLLRDRFVVDVSQQNTEDVLW